MLRTGEQDGRGLFYMAKNILHIKYYYLTDFYVISWHCSTAYVTERRVGGQLRIVYFGRKWKLICCRSHSNHLSIRAGESHDICLPEYRVYKFKLH
jgi:hypothetical protein